MQYKQGVEMGCYVCDEKNQKTLKKIKKSVDEKWKLLYTYSCPREEAIATRTRQRNRTLAIK